MDLQAIQLLIHRNHPQLEMIFNQFIQKYGIKLKFQRPEKIIEKIRKNVRFVKKSSIPMKQERPKQLQWCFEKKQYKLFIWVLIFYCYNESLQLSMLSFDHFEQIFTIIRSKNVILIKYEVCCILQLKKIGKKLWSNEEKQLFNKIVENYLDIFNNNLDNVNWKFLSFQLFYHSNARLFRSQKQIKERWENYLNPKVEKGQWTIEEDINLLTCVQTLGFQWKIISNNSLKARTQHNLKNRYFSLLNKWKKNNPEANQRNFLQKCLKQLNLMKKQKLNNENCHDFYRSRKLNAQIKGLQLQYETIDQYIISNTALSLNFRKDESQNEKTNGLFDEYENAIVSSQGQLYMLNDYETY